jgi:hypothetical protein
VRRTPSLRCGKCVAHQSRRQAWRACPTVASLDKLAKLVHRSGASHINLAGKRGVLALPLRRWTSSPRLSTGQGASHINLAGKRGALALPLRRWTSAPSLSTGQGHRTSISRASVACLPYRCVVGQARQACPQVRGVAHQSRRQAWRACPTVASLDKRATLVHRSGASHINLAGKRGALALPLRRWTSSPRLSTGQGRRTSISQASVARLPYGITMR